MSIEIEAPDGSIAEFPDGTPDTVIKAAMRKAFAPVQQKPQPSMLNTVADFVKSFDSSLVKTGAETLDMVSNASPGVTQARQALDMFAPDLSKKISMSNVVEQGVNKVFGGYHQPQTTAGEYAKTLGEFAPALAVGPEGLLPRVANWAGPALVSEFAGQQTKGTDAEPWARLGAALTGSGIVSGAERVPSLVKGLMGDVKTAAKVAPSTAEIKAASQAQYKASEDAGVVIHKDALARLHKDVADELSTLGFDPGSGMVSHAKSALDGLGQTAQSDAATLKHIDMMRQRAVLGTMQKNVDGSLTPDAFLSEKIIDKVDDFLDTLPESEATEALKGARADWRTYKKSSMLDRATNRAKIKAAMYSQAGKENALRAEFRALALNDRKMKSFSADEKAAIRSVAEGTITRNTLRQLGKMAPTSLLSMLTELGSMSVGALTGNLPLAGAGLAAFTVGTGAKYAATKMATKASDYASELVRGGPQVAQKAKALKQKQLSDALKRTSPFAAMALAPQEQQ